MKKYYSNGKLLITGEYVVLDGALSLALPTKFGQNLELNPIDVPKLIWKSCSIGGDIWFETEILISKLSILSSHKVTATLQKILIEAKKLNPSFLEDGKGFRIQTHLTFPNEWGLGTSSTLINNIASWANVDSFQLLLNSFGGSAYDIACAQNNTPVHYQLLDAKPVVCPIAFSPPFSERLFFVYLNKKQNSKEGIQLYNSIKKSKKNICNEISQITKEITNCSSFDEFENLLSIHEQMMANLLNLRPVKECLFSDYFGAIKSLGAWGGDFVLATGNIDTPSYFKSKGYHTVLTYREMVR